MRPEPIDGDESHDDYTYPDDGKHDTTFTSFLEFCQGGPQIMRKLSVFIAALLFLFTGVFAPVDAAQLFNYPKFSALAVTGQPMAGGKLYTYEQGTTTPKAAYKDRAMATAHANPIVLDSNGEETIYLNGFYKVVLKNSAGVTKWTMDKVEGINSFYFPAYEVDALETYGSGTSYTSTTIKAALTALGTTNPVTLVLRAGAWAKVGTDTITFTPNITLRMLGTFSGFSPGNITGFKEVRPEWWATNTNPGTTDMDNAINCAVQSGAKKIEFQATDYLFTLITVPANTMGLTMVGPANGYTNLKTATATGNGITFAGEADQFTMENITVYSTNASTGWGIYSNQLATAPFRYPILRNVSIYGFLKGIHVGGGVNVYIEGGNQTGQGKAVAGGIGIQIGEDDTHATNYAEITRAYPATYKIGIYNKYAGPLRVNGGIIADVTTAFKADAGVNELNSVYFDLADVAIEQGAVGAYIFNNTPNYASNGTNTITLLNTRYREVQAAMFPVRAGAAGSTSIAASTPTIITLATETYDSESQFTANAFTAKFPGFYKVKGQGTWDCRGVGTYKIHIYKNAAAVATASHRVVGTDAGVFHLPLSVSDTVWLAVGDTVSLYGEHDSATTPESVLIGTAATFLVIEGI
jgi:hypothetical protein